MRNRILPTRPVRRRRSLGFETCELRRLLTTTMELDALADLDQDGDLDVIRPGAWFENYDGLGNLSINRITREPVELMVAADLDGDGDLDLITSEPSWYENVDGRGQFSLPRSFPGVSEVSNVTQIRAHQLSDERGMDVVMLTDDEVLHFGHQRGGDLSLVERIERPRRAAAADLDGDGDLDLSFVDSVDLGDGFTSRRVVIRHNEGTAGFRDEVLISRRVHEPIVWFVGPTFTDIRDINVDGQPDVMVHYTSSDEPSFWWNWHVNQGGTIDESGIRIIGTSMANLTGIFDVDGDGDLDGIADRPQYSPEKLWAENDGTGIFNNRGLLCSCWPIGGGDLNGDGIADLLVGQFEAGLPRWIDGSTGQEHTNVAPPPELRPGDANRDFRFSAADLVLVAQHGKFGLEVDADWEEGDWNGTPSGAPGSPPVGNGRFDQHDLDLALATNLFERGRYRSTELPEVNDLQPLTLEWSPHGIRVQYEWETGDVSIVSGEPLTALHIASEAGLFTVPDAEHERPFDFADQDGLFQFDLTGGVGFDLGPVLPALLPWQTVLNDLKISGALVGGGSLPANVSLECIRCPIDIDEIQPAVWNGSRDQRFDLDGDGHVGQGDVRRLVHELLGTDFGDANRDGEFNSHDLVAVFQAGGYEDDIPRNATWSTGDWNSDGDFTSDDLVYALQVGSYEQRSPRVFAEPKTLAALQRHDNVRGIVSADVDGDGDADIIVGRHSSQNIGGGSNLDWFEYVDGRLAARHSIENNLARVSSIRASDIDNDGDVDLLASSIDDDTIAWFENTDGKGTFGPQQSIWSEADFALSVWTADIDGDGDQDALSSSLFDHEIAWFENLDGQGDFGASRSVRTGERSGYEAMVRAGDIDGDGDADVVSANGSSVSWSENDGAGGFVEHVIDLAAVGPFQRRGVLSVSVSDADDDGDLDILIGDTDQSRVSWFENLDGRGTFGTETVITNDALDVRLVSTGDFDNDGDQDALMATFYGQLEWFEGLPGELKFGPARVVSTTAFFGAVEILDFDQDGDLDLISTGGQAIVWHENLTIADR